MMYRNLDRAITFLWVIVTVTMPVAIWMVFLYVPDERVMGAAQRIFYFHVPSALVMFGSVFVLLAGSIGYLWTRNLGWDNLSRAATETGLVFCTIVLTTGPLWAKPAWGIWWTWEAKLTTTLVLWLLLVGCLMVRNHAENRDVGARLAAIVGIIAAVDVPIIHKATVWWRGQHPVVFKPNETGLSTEMSQTFGFCMLQFLLFFTLVLAVRWRLAQTEDRVAAAAERMEGI